MVWLSGLLPYAQCAEVFERIGEQRVPITNIWRQTQRHAERLQAAIQPAEEEAEVPCAAAVPEPSTESKGLSMDGGMVNIRDEGWREFKIGAVFDLERRLERDRDTNDFVERVHGVAVSYTACLGSTTQFAPRLRALATQRQISAARQSLVVADGSEWIWNIATRDFPHSVQILDWYHANQHLNQAAKALHPADSQQAQAWLAQAQKHLFQGQIEQITRPLHEHNLASQATYFHTHQHRMQYHDFQQQGFPLGSGTIESGVKQFKARLTGAGMRWSRSAAEFMLALRAAVLAQSFDQFWETA